MFNSLVISDGSEVKTDQGRDVEVDVPSLVITRQQLPRDSDSVKLGEYEKVPDIDILPPPVTSAANPPPPREEEHEANLGELNVKVHPLSTLTYTPPPYPPLAVQCLNVMDGSVNDEERDVNSNTLPFPLNRVMFSNVTSAHDRLPIFLSNSGVLFVPYFELPPLILIEFRITLPPLLTDIKLHPFSKLFFNSIVNPVMFSSPLGITNAVEDAKEVVTSNVTDGLDRPVMKRILSPTSIPVLSLECVPARRRSNLRKAEEEGYELATPSVIDAHGYSEVPHDVEEEEGTVSDGLTYTGLYGSQSS